MTALTETERSVLAAFADGDTAHVIAKDFGLAPSAVRGLLHRTCAFDEDRARALLNGHSTPNSGVIPSPTPSKSATPAEPPTRSPTVTQPSPTPPAKPPAKRPKPTVSLEVYRELDYWTSRGYIKAIDDGTTGRHRQWSIEERDVGLLLARLVTAGLTTTAAGHAARNELQLLDPHIRLILDDQPGDDYQPRHAVRP